MFPSSHLAPSSPELKQSFTVDFTVHRQSWGPGRRWDQALLIYIWLHPFLSLPLSLNPTLPPKCKDQRDQACTQLDAVDVQEALIPSNISPIPCMVLGFVADRTLFLRLCSHACCSSAESALFSSQGKAFLSAWVFRSLRGVPSQLTGRLL